MNRKMTYSYALELIEKFDTLHDEKYQNVVAGCKNKLIFAKNLYEAQEFISKDDFDSAITKYKDITEQYPQNDFSLDEKISEVLESAEVRLNEKNKNQSYKEISEFISELKQDCQNSELKEFLAEKELSYLFEYLEMKRADNKFIGNEGVLYLCQEYDALVEGSDTAHDVSAEYQQYIQQCIDSEKYHDILSKLDSDYYEMSKYPDYFDMEVYNNFRVLCAAKLLDEARAAGNYTGFDGAIRMCSKVNAYKENSVDKFAVINEYADIQRNELVQWINEERAARGLTQVTIVSGLNDAAKEMLMNNVLDGRYNKDTFWDKFYPIIADYGLSSNGYGFSTWMTNIATAQELESSIKRDGVDGYSFLCEKNYTKAGVGMIYDEAKSTFSWLVVTLE